MGTRASLASLYKDGLGPEEVNETVEVYRRLAHGQKRLPEALGPGLFGRALDAVFVGAFGQALDALFGFGVGGEHLLDVA